MGHSPIPKAATLPGEGWEGGPQGMESWVEFLTPHSALGKVFYVFLRLHSSGKSALSASFNGLLQKVHLGLSPKIQRMSLHPEPGPVGLATLGGRLDPLRGFGQRAALS